IHGEPPFGARPPWTLTGRRTVDQDFGQVVGYAVRTVLGEPGGEVPGEPIFGRHDGRPSTRSGRICASVSRATRILARAQRRGDFAGPSGMPRVAATVGIGRSR